MRKNKGLLLGLFTSLCSFMLFGVVNAAQATLNNVEVVCDPAEVDVGEISTCYLIGKLDTRDSAGIYALKNNIVLTDLSFESAKGFDESKVGMEKTSGTGSTNKFTHLTNESEQLCKSVIGEQGEFCVLFYSKGEANAFTDENTTSYKGDKNSRKLLGQFVVKLVDGQNGCGKICVKTTKYDSAAGEGMAAQTEGNSTSNKGHCDEIHKLNAAGEEEPTPTGNSLSYIILIAGAVLAIGAVLIAKKNNKFYRV